VDEESKLVINNFFEMRKAFNNNKISRHKRI
jgi:hypothetical protein